MEEIENTEVEEGLTPPDKEEIARILADESDGALKEYLEPLHPADIAELLMLLPDEDDWPRVIKYLNDEDASLVLEELPEHQRQKMVHFLSTQRLSAIVGEMDTDDAADLLAELPDKQVETILHSMDEEDAEDIQQLMSYPDDSAGGIMQTELASMESTLTVREAIASLREMHQEIEELRHIYVTDKDGKFLGLVPIIRLLYADQDTTLDDLKEPAVITVPPQLDQEDVARLFRKYDLVSMPVVDENEVLLGRILIDDVVDVLDEEASEDMLRFVGTSSEDLVYGNKIFSIIMRRLPWLVSNLLGGLITGYLITKFDNIKLLDAMILISFVPVITAMAGNMGSQSATIVIRGFALGKVQLHNLSRTFIRELLVGLSIGLICGILVGSIGAIHNGAPLVGIIVGTSMMISMTTAALMGVAVPSFFKLIGTDPAIASGPLVTTVLDITGILIYLANTQLLLTLLA